MSMTGMKCSTMVSLGKQKKAVLDKYLKHHRLHIALSKQGLLMEVPTTRGTLLNDKYKILRKTEEETH